MYEPATPITNTETALVSLENDRSLGAFDPNDWRDGDPISEFVEAFLEPGSSVDSEAVIAAWIELCCEYMEVIRQENAYGIRSLTYSLETSPDGQVLDRHLVMNIADGYSLTVSENSEYAIAVLPNGEGEEETVIPAAGHPLRALLQAVADQPEVWRLERLSGWAWDLRLAEPEELPEDLVEEIESIIRRGVEPFNPDDWVPGDPIPDYIGSRLEQGAPIDSQAVSVAYWDWALEWLHHNVGPSGEPLAKVLSTPDGQVASVTVRLDDSFGGRSEVATDSSLAKTSIPRPDSRGLWPEISMEKLAHPLSGLLDIVVTSLGAPNLATVSVPEHVRGAVRKSLLGQHPTSPTSVPGPGGSRRPDAAARKNRKARRKAQKESRRRNRKPNK